MTRFEVGRTYKAHSVCDYNAIWNCKVIKRTAKRMTIEINGKEVKTVGITARHNTETAQPIGNYSMAPMIRA